MIYGQSREWIWATPDPQSGQCPAGFAANSWGCSQRREALGTELWVPGASVNHCPPGFSVTSAGCVKRRTFGDTPTTSRATNPVIWLGVGGLLLSAGLMIAMGFHKPPQPSRRRYR